MIKEIISKYKFDNSVDRIGPDFPFTHWKLYFKSSMKKLCEDKFLYFGKNSEFRAGAYAFSCSKIFIGDRVVIRPNTTLFADPNYQHNDGKIILENDVLIGAGVHIYVSNHKYNMSNVNIIDQGHSRSKTVILREGC